MNDKPGSGRLNALLAFTAVAVMAGIPGRVDGQQSADLTRLLRIEHADLQSAYTLAQSVCETEMERASRDERRMRAERPDAMIEYPTCRIETLQRDGMLAITADPELRERIVGLIAELDRTPATRSFHIIVLAGSRGAGGAAPDVPEAARLALADVGEFLPYSSFRVLGSGWLRTSRAGETTLPGEMEFTAGLNFRASSEVDAPIMIESFRIDQRVPPAFSPSGELIREEDYRGVLETTFTIDPGETVVVGTSKLNGDEEAIIVLLTAVRS